MFALHLSHYSSCLGKIIMVLAPLILTFAYSNVFGLQNQNHTFKYVPLNTILSLCLFTSNQSLSFNSSDYVKVCNYNCHSLICFPIKSLVFLKSFVQCSLKFLSVNIYMTIHCKLPNHVWPNKEHSKSLRSGQ